MSNGSESTQILTASPTAAQPWHAGADLSRPEACPHCQATIALGEEFCSRCGYQRGTWQASAVGDGAAVAGSASTGAAPETALILRAADGRSFALPEGETVAGRGEVALRLDDSFISRHHARFNVDGDQVTVTDLGSSNGTFVGEARLEPQAAMPLAVGDSLRLGQLELTVERNPAAFAAVGDSPGLAEEAAPASTEEPSAPSVDLASPERDLSPWALRGADGTALELPLGTVTLGRKAGVNDLVISDGYISGQHCRFEATLTGLSITDVGSTNGSFINGERLERDMEHTLRAGDALRLGQTELLVELSGGAGAVDDAETTLETANEPAF